MKRQDKTIPDKTIQIKTTYDTTIQEQYNTIPSKYKTLQHKTMQYQDKPTQSQKIQHKTTQAKYNNKPRTITRHDQTTQEQYKTR